MLSNQSALPAKKNGKYLSSYSSSNSTSVDKKKKKDKYMTSYTNIGGLAGSSLFMTLYILMAILGIASLPILAIGSVLSYATGASLGFAFKPENSAKYVNEMRAREIQEQSDKRRDDLVRAALRFSAKMKEYAYTSIPMKKPARSKMYEKSAIASNNLQEIADYWEDVKHSMLILKLETLYEKDLPGIISSMHSTSPQSRRKYDETLEKIVDFAMVTSQKVVDAIHDGKVIMLETELELIESKYSLDWENLLKDADTDSVNNREIAS